MKTGVEMLAVEQSDWVQAIGAEIERQCFIGAGGCGTADDGSGLFEVRASLDLNGFAQAMMAVARATHPAATGSVRGWKLVPVKATALMEQAGSGYIFEDGINHEARCDAATHVWSAMLAAAPTPDAAASDAAVPAGEDDGEDERPLTAKERAMIDAAWERHKTARPCTIPPAGWRCTRTGGHDGPCAAVLAAAPKVASDTDAAASEAGDGWQDIASAPRDGTPFIATLIVHNLSGQKWWETHVIWADDETGEVATECEAGWTRVDDYSHWMPMPAPPAALTTQGGVKG